MRRIISLLLIVATALVAVSSLVLEASIPTASILHQELVELGQPVVSYQIPPGQPEISVNGNSVQTSASAQQVNFVVLCGNALRTQWLSETNQSYCVEVSTNL